jgi:hypothetical protein
MIQYLKEAFLKAKTKRSHKAFTKTKHTEKEKSKSEEKMAGTPMSNPFPNITKKFTDP